MIITTRRALSTALMQEALDPRSTMPEKEALAVEDRELTLSYLAEACDNIETAQLRLKNPRIAVALDIIDIELSLARAVPTIKETPSLPVEIEPQHDTKWIDGIRAQTIEYEDKIRTLRLALANEPYESIKRIIQLQMDVANSQLQFCRTVERIWGEALDMHDSNRALQA